jgi:pimeloyl-ACP methyl ester carboxylesterase
MRVTSRSFLRQTGLFILAFLSLLNPVISSAQATFSYSDQGHGKALILIHAFPTDKQLWLPQINGLSANFRVITLDLAGFGNAEKTDGQVVTMNAYASQVKALMDKLHISKAIIGGESMGGYVALTFLKQYPEKVRALILSDTRSVADSEQTKIDREKSAQDVLANGSAKLIANFMPKALSPEADEVTRLSLQHILEQQSAEGIASALRGMAAREDTSSVLSATKLPVLIMTGDKDALISPQESRNMHALAKNSKLIEIKNAGHLASLEQPEQWNQAVIEMFDKA